MSLIIDPSRRQLPLMYSIQDAAKLNVQEKTTFYVSAFLFQLWLCEFTLANTAQLAEKSDPQDRSFQTGEAWRGFQKYFGKCSDAEFATVFGHLMEFADCDDLMAEHVREAAFPLSVEHDLTGEFLGKHTPAALLAKPTELLALTRATTHRLCDWLEAACQYQTFHEWHVMPDCFDPDPQKRELAYLAINQQYFDLLSEHRWLNHMSDAVEELKNSPKWAVFRHVSKNEPLPRPWPANHLDHFIIKLWPLVKRYHWSGVDLLHVLRKVLDSADLAQCPDEQKLVAYCADSLSLRYAGLESNRSHGTKLPAYNVALRLCAAEPSDP